MGRAMIRLFPFLLLLLVSQAEAAARFAVCAVTCTWDASDTTMWSASTGGATGASVPGTSDSVTLDGATCVGGVTCTITVNTNVAVVSLTMGACTAATAGCILDFSVNNNSVTLSSVSTPMSCTGTGTRTLRMGTNTWTLSGVSSGSTIWSCGTTTNMTLTPSTSTISITGNHTGVAGFQGGGLTYGNISIGANAALGGVNFTTTATNMASLSIAAPASVAFSPLTFTITNAFTITASSSSFVTISNNAPFGNTAATISIGSGTATCSYCILRYIAFTGGATFTFTNTLTSGLVTGASISAPSFGTGGGRIIGG